MTATADGAGGIGRVAVPAALAVLTWAVLLVVAGSVIRFGPLTAYGVVRIAVLAAALWPVYAFAPWRPHPRRRFAWWVEARRRPLALATGLAVALLAVLALDGPPWIVTALALPGELVEPGLYRVAGLYRDLAGRLVAYAVLGFARWYLTGLWLYGVAAGILHVWGVVREG